jgi:hypothetical protein
VLRVAVSARPGDEFSQSGDLGERCSQVSGRVERCYANFGRGDDHPM